ncbi:Folylpolyglutamate synthase [Lacunisphaera limnophila]|uniref:Dihydrofolate synthase/folylpolyglutamate synthase n=1 Tax=Lacunisphaera limnophila TaxID=1838286 RepID=A0A1D8AXC7_9BACT|nr:folylpolyglutamate synthase/dihydrofolate synthase family protein [Lacunisphaera limnophila]AOS45531.1 Folylpolyglutamate synthase [Lacunisphaera limnophila]
MADQLSDYAAVKDYLYGLKAGGVKFGIDRMQRLAAALGHPERSYPVIHVAGTNGKGSVSAMLEAIFRAAGWRTGLYTSPHLVRLGERVQVDRQPLTEAEIVAYTRELRPVAERAAAEAADEHATFFEFMTAMAFLQFQRERADVAVIEVGLGGRLDATNVVRPEIAVITSIGLDHCAELGGTLAQIAREKGGIIKPGRPVVIGRMPAEAEQVLREIATERGAPVHSVRDVFGEAQGNYPVTNLEGDCQRWNAATATLAARLFIERWSAATEPGANPSGLSSVDLAKAKGRIPPTADDITRGLARVDWPGRWQRLSVGGRALILDASHNPEGAVELDKNLTRLVAETGRKPVVVAGALGEFRAKALLEVVLRHAAAVWIVTPHQNRATPFEDMLGLVPPELRSRVRRGELAEIFPNPQNCTVGQPGDTVVVTGSIYLLGEVLERLAPAVACESRLQDF